MAESINLSRQGQLAVRDPSFQPTVPVVDIPNACAGQVSRM